MSAGVHSPGNPAGGARRRGRARLDLRRLGRVALLGGASSRDGLPHALEHVAKAHRGFYPDADIPTLRTAYLLAEDAHRGQTRKSGDPYITHPLAVTLILAELGAETTTLTASLLHDTVEDTEVTLDQVRAGFGEEVAYLVDGVTKLEKVDYGAAAEPETFRKMLVATGSDVRVMSIKLADRLHNMRTLGVMRREKQVRIARVTHDVLIPLAERLGVQAIKTELEDLVFAVLHPEDYARSRELLLANAGRPDPLEETAAEMREVLHAAGITAEVAIRPRHVVSVHRVLKKRGELRGTDFGRLLVLVPEAADCYAVLGELHTCFKPVPAEFKDFIAVPKFNLYQSLHTAVADQRGYVVETLVRSRQMHRVAEAGVVALASPLARPAAGQVGDWLKRLLEWQRATPDPDAFWSALREDLAPDQEITVFCDPGGPLVLPAGASCVDAAYARHGETAHTLVGARVNGRLAGLGTRLRDGDTLTLLLAPEASGPAPEWLDHAQTPAARIAITRWLADHPAARIADAALPLPADYAPAAAVATALPGSPADDVTADVTAGAPAVLPAEGVPRAAEPAVAELPDAALRLARCCTPVPPDAVTGFVVRGGAVAVHRAQCASVARMAAAGRRELRVHWRTGEGAPPADLRVTLKAEAFVRAHLLADLTEAIAAEGVAIVAADVEPPRQQRVRHTYTLLLPDPAGLPGLMRAMRRVPGVYDVSRAQHPPGADRQAPGVRARTR
ncbi:HD domain-containing protein [Streptomyces sp. WMMC500]|uniref:RelA/SpoT family protein n=1 Tax=Streptomyces sp. WMMC500 TaxID=3015154 RepID=UPI00248AB790|nr:HD domain-containing protein [Streptomyces sp. WMMC500]WBB62660.1 HD domain-containing protein [Streptomyces sp. WMMC500]